MGVWGRMMRYDYTRCVVTLGTVLLAQVCT